MTSGTSWGGESTPSLFLMRTNFPFLCPGGDAGKRPVSHVDNKCFKVYLAHLCRAVVHACLNPPL